MNPRPLLRALCVALVLSAALALHGDLPVNVTALAGAARRLQASALRWIFVGGVSIS